VVPVPDGWTDRHFFLVAVVLYGVSTLYALLVWRRDFRQDQRLLYGLLALGWGLHTWAMVQRGFSLSRCPINNLFEATLFILWTVGVSYLLMGLFHKLRFLGVLVAPLLFVSGVFALMPALDVRGPKPEFTHGLESLHAAFILLAYGAFGLGSVAAVLYLVQEHNFKAHKARALAALLPSLARLERVTGQLLAGGVILLTGGLVTGILYLERRTGSYWSTDPFVLYSLGTWLLYLGLLVGRWGFSQRGRRLALGAVASFAFIMMTFWGIYLLSGLHNRRPEADREAAAGPAPAAMTWISIPWHSLS
jgi:ABC-type uncharacterized transport system permease subunit